MPFELCFSAITSPLAMNNNSACDNLFVTSSKAISVLSHSITFVCIAYLNEKSNYNNKKRTRTSVKEVLSSRNLAERKHRNTHNVMNINSKSDEQIDVSNK